MTTTHDIETIGHAPSNELMDYITRKWRSYVVRGLTFRSRDAFVRTDGPRIDSSCYDSETVADWRKCVADSGYVGSLADHAFSPVSTGCQDAAHHKSGHRVPAL